MSRRYQEKNVACMVVWDGFMNIGIYLILLYFTDTGVCFCSFFTNWRFVVTLHWASLLVLFSYRICSLCVFVLHLRILAIIKNISLLYLFWWSMIFNLLLQLFWGTTKTFLCKTPDLIYKCCMWCDCAINQPFPHLTPSPLL